MWNEWKVYESLFVLLYLDLVPQRRWSRIDQIGRGWGGVGLWAKSHQLHTVTNQVQSLVRCCKVITLTINCDVSLIPASEWWSRPMKYSYECWVCITYHVTAVSHTTWLLLFSIVFKTLRIIWCHKRHSDIMILPPIRTALAIVEAFTGIHFSNIYWIGLSWRFCRRFAVCSYKSNQTFECWIQISRYFFNLSEINFAKWKRN